jgi:hypothetical protein
MAKISISFRGQARKCARVGWKSQHDDLNVAPRLIDIAQLAMNVNNKAIYWKAVPGWRCTWSEITRVVEKWKRQTCLATSQLRPAFNPPPVVISLVNANIAHYREIPSDSQ